MSKKYQNQKSGFTVVSGKIKSISEDKLSSTVSVETWDNVKKARVPEDIVITTLYPIEEEKIGDVITATGYLVRGQIQAESFSKDALYVESAPVASQAHGLAVLAGLVLFANKNDEIDKTTGQPRLNQAGQPKKPHFDITIPVGTGEERVTHTVRIYNMPERKKEDGTVIPAQDNISRYEKLFANFDRKTNPIYCSIITQPGQTYTRKNVVGTREYENTCMSHLGANSVDATFMQERVADKSKENQENVPTTAPIPEKEEITDTKESSGFDAGNFSMDDLEPDFTLD